MTKDTNIIDDKDEIKWYKILIISVELFITFKSVINKIIENS